MDPQLHWIHLHKNDWVGVETLQWDEYGGEYGTVCINGVEFTFIVSYDGDGYLQIADNDIDRCYEVAGCS